MTVKVNDRRKEYPGDGLATSFNGPMAYRSTDLVVNLVDQVTNVAVSQPTSAFTLSGLGRNTGTRIVMNVAPPAGQTLQILRTVPFSQDVNITNQGAFNAEALEQADDLLGMQIQQIDDRQSRSLQFGDDVLLDPDFDPVITVAPEPHWLVGVRPDGKGFDLLEPPAIATLANDTVTDPKVAAGAGIQGTKLNFLQAGTGAVNRTVQKKQQETVSVLDYGADPTNSVDSSPAFQAAINYILTLADGGRVYVPPGRYRLLSQIQVPVSSGRGKVIFGDGAASVIVTSLVSGNVPAFYVGAAVASGNVNTHFESLRFDGALGTGKAVLLSNGNTAKFTNCHFIDMEQGVVLTESYAVRFDKCVFKAISNYAIVTTTSAHHLTLNNCNFYDCGAGVAFGTAIQIATPTDNVVLRDCDFEGNRRVMVCNGGSSFVVDGCYIENGLTSLIDVSGATKINGLSIRNCWISNNPAWQISNVDGGEITLCKINVQTITFTTTNVSNFSVGNNYLVSATVASPPATAVASFFNGYTGSNVGYKRYNDGTIELFGTITLGTNNTGAFILPAGFRPKITVVQPVCSTSAVLGTILIDAANGNVVPNIAGANVVLNGIRFST